MQRHSQVILRYYLILAHWLRNGRILTEWHVALFWQSLAMPHGSGDSHRLTMSHCSDGGQLGYFWKSQALVKSALIESQANQWLDLQKEKKKKKSHWQPATTYDPVVAASGVVVGGGGGGGRGAAAAASAAECCRCGQSAMLYSLSSVATVMTHCSGGYW